MTAGGSLAELAGPNRSLAWVLDSARLYARRAVPSGYVRIMAADLPHRSARPVAPPPRRPRLAWPRRPTVADRGPAAASRWSVDAASTAGMAQGLAATCIDVVTDIAASTAWQATELDQQRGIRVDLARERFRILGACADLHELRTLLGGDVDTRDDSGATELLADAVQDRRQQYTAAESAAAQRIATLRSYLLGLVQIEALLHNRDLALTLTRSVLDADDLHDRIVAANTGIDTRERSTGAAIELAELEANLDGQLRYLASLIARPAIPLFTS